MNPLIKELASKALKQPDTDNDGLTVFDNDELTKFAQLIVRECVQTLIDNTPERYTNESAEEDWDKGYDRAMKDCVHHIQEHFGVEE